MEAFHEAARPAPAARSKLSAGTDSCSISLEGRESIVCTSPVTVLDSRGTFEPQAVINTRGYILECLNRCDFKSLRFQIASTQDPGRQQNGIAQQTIVKNN